ncbi:hypothetical protein DIPPA_33169 [Diplonema papillatum]|nr:hypothetical protein DIPPA_33169 [Diplonema papillatum]
MEGTRAGRRALLAALACSAAALGSLEVCDSRPCGDHLCSEVTYPDGVVTYMCSCPDGSAQIESDLPCLPAIYDELLGGCEPRYLRRGIEYDVVAVSGANKETCAIECSSALPEGKCQAFEVVHAAQCLLWYSKSCVGGTAAAWDGSLSKATYMRQDHTHWDYVPEELSHACGKARVTQPGSTICVDPVTTGQIHCNETETLNCCYKSGSMRATCPVATPLFCNEKRCDDYCCSDDCTEWGGVLCECQEAVHPFAADQHCTLGPCICNDGYNRELVSGASQVCHVCVPIETDTIDTPGETGGCRAADALHRCTFPFVYGNKTHAGCMSIPAVESFFCYIEGAGLLECGEACPRSNLATPVIRDEEDSAGFTMLIVAFVLILLVGVFAIKMFIDYKSHFRSMQRGYANSFEVRQMDERETELNDQVIE